MEEDKMEEQELQNNEQQLVDEQDNEQEVEEALFSDESENDSESDELSNEFDEEAETDENFEEVEDEETEEEGVEDYGEDDIINDGEQEAEQPAEQPEPEEVEQPKQTETPTNSGFFMKPEFTPGTEEFFKAVYADAKAKTEQSLGEEFDQYNPEHIARLNYFNNVAQQERIEEYHKGVEYIKRQEEQARYNAAVEKKTQEVTAYLSNMLPSKEEQLAFAEILEDKISRKHYRQLEEQVANGDYSGVEKLIRKVKQITGTASGNETSRNQKYVSSKGKDRKPLASDLFI